MTGRDKPGIAGVPQLIREAAVEISMAAARYDAIAHVIVPTVVIDWLATWLFSAATRETEHRATNPGWAPADEWEEAWTAAILAAYWLRRDPADYDITPPEEES